MLTHYDSGAAIIFLTGLNDEGLALKLIGDGAAIQAQKIIDALSAPFEVEITESAILDNVERIAALLGHVRARGISVSIDDFGTGYSSLSHLKHLPVDKLKIDRSFVSHIMGNEGDAEIVSATISLAQTFGLKVIAEGVEEQAQLNFLRTKLRDQAQGYHISRPLTATDFTEWYRRHESDCLERWDEAC